MSRLDTGLWGPSATLPDEPPIDGEQPQRHVLDEQERERRAKSWERAKLLLKPAKETER